MARTAMWCTMLAAAALWIAPGHAQDLAPEQKSLGKPPQQAEVRLAPGAGRLAWAEFAPEGHRVIVDGTAQPWYADVRGLTISPSGARVAYCARDGQQWKLILDGRAVATIPEDVAVSFSPDGKRFAFTTAVGGKSRLTLDGTPGPEMPGTVQAPVAFSPDGARYAYVLHHGQTCSAVVDGMKQAAYSAVRNVTFSADCKHVAYVAHDEAADKQFMILDGNAVGEHSLVMVPRFSPTGRLAYAASDGDGWCVIVDGQKGPRHDAISQMDFVPGAEEVAYVAQDAAETTLRVGGRSYPWKGDATADVRTWLTSVGETLYYITEVDAIKRRAVCAVRGEEVRRWVLGDSRIQRDRWALGDAWGSCALLPGGHLLSVLDRGETRQVLLDALTVGTPWKEPMYPAPDGVRWWLGGTGELVFGAKDGAGAFHRVSVRLPDTPAWEARLPELDESNRILPPASLLPPWTGPVASANGEYPGFPLSPSSAPLPAQASDPRTGAPVVDGRAIVGLKPKTSFDQAQSFVASFGGKVVGGVGVLGLLEVDVPTLRTVAGLGTVQRIVGSSSRADYFDTLCLVAPMKGPAGQGAPAGGPIPQAVAPLERTVADPAAEFGRWSAGGLSLNWPWRAVGITGDSLLSTDAVALGVIADGVAAGHPDLQGVVEAPPAQTSETVPELGTHLCGLIAARADGKGITGVAAGAKLRTVGARTVLDVCSAVASLADAGCRAIVVAAAVPWNRDARFHPAVDDGRTRTQVQSQVQLLGRAADYAASKGALIVAAAGDDALAGEWSPWALLAATRANVLAVGAGAFTTGAATALASYSNRGAGIGLVAPGGESIEGQDARLGIIGCDAAGSYGFMNGSAQAAAITAAAAGLVWSSRPALKPAEVRTALIEGSRRPGAVAQGSECPALDVAAVLRSVGVTVAQARPEEGPPIPPVGGVSVVRPVEEAPEPLVLIEVGTPETGLRKLARVPSPARYPSWSPDASRILFDSQADGNSDIYVVNSDGYLASPIIISPGADLCPSWSPDGSRIAYQTLRDGNFEVCIADATGANPRILAAHPAFDGEPEWSPDGTRIAFASSRDGNLEIYLMNADGSNLTRITDAPGNDVQPTWAPDGRTLAFVSDRTGAGDVYTVSIDDLEAKLLTGLDGSEWHPCWSPDGKRIAFTWQGDIHDVSPDSRGLRRLTSDPAQDLAPSWDAGGARIAFHSDRGGSWGIHVMEVEPVPDALAAAAPRIPRRKPPTQPVVETPPAVVVETPQEPWIPDPPAVPEPKEVVFAYDGPAEPIELNNRQYATLSEAMAVARAGDTVMLGRGTYRECAVLKGVSLVGKGKTQTRLVWGGEGCTIRALEGQGSIEGIWVVREGTADRALHADAGQWAIRDCLFEGGEDAVGIDAAEVTMADCDVTRTAKHGVVLIHSARVSLENCDIYDLAGADGVALGVMGKSEARATNCRAWDIALHAFYVVDGGVMTLDRCVAARCKWVGCMASGNGEARAMNCRFAHNEHYGVYIAGEVLVELTECKIHDNGEFGVVTGTTIKFTATRCEIMNNTRGLSIAPGLQPTLLDNRIHDNPQGDTLGLPR